MWQLVLLLLKFSYIFSFDVFVLFFNWPNWMHECTWTTIQMVSIPTYDYYRYRVVFPNWKQHSSIICNAVFYVYSGRNNMFALNVMKMPKCFRFKNFFDMCIHATPSMSTIFQINSSHRQSLECFSRLHHSLWTIECCQRAFRMADTHSRLHCLFLSLSLSVSLSLSFSLSLALTRSLSLPLSSVCSMKMRKYSEIFESECSSILLKINWKLHNKWVKNCIFHV